MTNTLRLVDSLVGEYQPGPDGTTGVEVSIEPGATPALFVNRASTRKRRARDRYLMTAQVLTLRFALVDRKSRLLPFV
jgi:hypothetical protein